MPLVYAEHSAHNYRLRTGKLRTAARDDTFFWRSVSCSAAQVHIVYIRRTLRTAAVTRDSCYFREITTAARHVCDLSNDNTCHTMARASSNWATIKY